VNLNLRNGLRRIVLFAVALATLALPMNASIAGTVETSAKKIRFWVPHRPENPFNKRLLDNFSKRVRERSAGSLEVLVEFDMDEHQEGALNRVLVGEKEMSQVAVDRMTRINHKLDVLDMPLMFRGHEHAEKVLDGKIGKELLHAISTGSNGHIKGMGFTYSGGVRVIYGLQNLTSLSDLVGKKMRLRGGRAGQDMMDHLGLKFTFGPYKDWFFKAHLNGEIDAEEVELNRVAAYKSSAPASFAKIQSVLETNHSLYLTALLVNGEFFNSLNAKQKQVLQEEIEKFAKDERNSSIEQAAASRESLMKDGIKINTLSPGDQRTLKKIGAVVRKKYSEELGSLMKRIEAVSSDNRLFLSGR